MSAVGLLLALVGRVVFSFVDPAITESSGLVDLGGSMVTTNDSGGAPLVFVVDPTSGRTVGRTTFTDHTVDVEALAPAGGDTVWVGDIGDNNEQRDSVQVYRVPVARGDRTVAAPSYELTYPDGAHDAESLLAAPDGRLYVVSKGLLGGTVYAAPSRLDPDHPNRLTAVAAVDIWATDAAIFPDGKHVLVRGYDSAVVYTFPAFTPVASVDLPQQRQGEGVSIGTSGRIRLSSEGRNSAVLEVALPAAVTAAMAGATPSRSTSSSGTPTPAAGDTPRAGDAAPAPRWLLFVAGGTAVSAALIVLALVAPRRSRRGRER